MVKTIFSTAAFFIVVMLALLIAMENGFLAGGESQSGAFTLRQATLFFSIYVFFQVWNQINARALTPDVSGFHRLLANPPFLAVAGLVAIGQIVIVTFGNGVFAVEPLGIVDWLGVIGFTASVLVFAEITRRFRQTSPLSPPGVRGRHQSTELL
jgi:Ca2+-transporting ATPase